MNVPDARKVTLRTIREALPTVTSEGTARVVYGAMLDEQIAPVMESWGFARDGAIFTYPSTVWFLSVGFDSSRLGTVAWHRFGAGVMAVSRGAWEQWRILEPDLPEVPDPRVYYAHDFVLAGGLATRLQELQGKDGDRSWTVRRDQDPTPVAADVLWSVHRHVLPEFRGRAEAPAIAG